MGGGGRNSAKKGALALIFRRNYCIQFTTFVANAIKVPMGLGTPILKRARILNVSLKIV